jgi:hypothetical protein
MMKPPSPRSQLRKSSKADPAKVIAALAKQVKSGKAKSTVGRLVRKGAK